MAPPKLLSRRINDDQRLFSSSSTSSSSSSSTSSYAAKHVPPTRAAAFRRFEKDDLLPYNLTQDEFCGLRDSILNTLQLQTLIAQVLRGNEYKPVDTDEAGRAMPHATVGFANGKNNTSFLGVDLFLFEIPVAYQVMGVVAEEYAPKKAEKAFLVRVAYEKRVVAALRGHIVRKKGNQYHARDILLLKTLLTMLGESKEKAKESTSGACKFPCIELVSRIIDKPGNADRERVQAMMLAAAEVYVDLRVVEQESGTEKRRIFFHGRADGTIENNNAPQSLQNAIPSTAAAGAA